jgi:hypothetical protein
MLVGLGAEVQFMLHRFPLTGTGLPVMTTIATIVVCLGHHLVTLLIIWPVMLDSVHAEEVFQTAAIV